jgi:hypothetical protein
MSSAHEHSDKHSLRKMSVLLLKSVMNLSLTIKGLIAVEKKAAGDPRRPKAPKKET